MADIIGLATTVAQVAMDAYFISTGIQLSQQDDDSELARERKMQDLGLPLAGMPLLGERSSPKFLSRNIDSHFMLGYGWSGFGGCKLLAYSFSTDPRIQSYLQRWSSYNCTPAHNEGVYISSDCWTSGTGSQQIRGIDTDIRRLVQFWRGSVDVYGLAENGSRYEMLRRCRAAQPDSIEWLHRDFLSTLKGNGNQGKTFVVFVEDMSAWIISLLGAYLDIAPCEFNRHLSSGGRYVNYASSLEANGSVYRSETLEGVLPIYTTSPVNLRDLELQSQMEAMFLFHATGSRLRSHSSHNSSAKSYRTGPELIRAFENFRLSDRNCRLQIGRNVLRPVSFIGESEIQSHLFQDQVRTTESASIPSRSASLPACDYFVESKITIRIHSNASENAPVLFLCFTDPRMGEAICPNKQHIRALRCYQDRLERNIETHEEQSSQHNSMPTGIDYSYEKAIRRTLCSSGGLEELMGHDGSHRDVFELLFSHLYQEQMDHTLTRAGSDGPQKTPREATESALLDSLSRFRQLHLYSWREAFDRVRELLDSIGASASLDEVVIDNIDIWRDCFARLELFLSTSKLQLENIEESLNKPSTSTNVDASALALVQNLEKSCSVLYERLNRVSQTVLSTISVLESKEAINEAHAVTRLTELAFIFIPLSFASSVFGMDVLEWEPHKPSIKAFFTLSASLLVCAYLARILLRSSRIKNVKVSLRDRVIDKRSELNPSRQIAPISSLEAVKFCLKATLRTAVRKSVYTLLVGTLASSVIFSVPGVRPFLALDLARFFIIVQAVAASLAIIPFVIIAVELRLSSFRAAGTKKLPVESLEFTKAFLYVYEENENAFIASSTRARILRATAMVLLQCGIPLAVIWFIWQPETVRYPYIIGSASVLFFAVNRLMLWKDLHLAAVYLGVAYFIALPSLLIFAGDLGAVYSWALSWRIGASVGFGVLSGYCSILAMLCIGAVQWHLSDKLQKNGYLSLGTVDPFQYSFFRPLNNPQLKKFEELVNGTPVLVVGGGPQRPASTVQPKELVTEKELRGLAVTILKSPLLLPRYFFGLLACQWYHSCQRGAAP
ncbi:hypothetical protein BJ508DRAFT_412596 [Ascobolus immersus RN42]|uniref:Uncharacterized protein n=1 Tax=Ascobolus immersus RN42 TaxID=1160509 RepID=A0A3N4IEE9_ASCIM|nr:hypothetical protein BJ508DRAFT_412596 [Ascobolus immersus RN42]